MMTGWPSRSDSSLETARAMMSVALPGVKATMMCTGFCGQVCAWAVLVAASASPAAAIKRRIMFPPFFSFSGNLPADAGHVKAAQDSFTRSGQLATDALDIGAHKFAVA